MNLRHAWFRTIVHKGSTRRVVCDNCAKKYKKDLANYPMDCLSDKACEDCGKEE